MKENKSFYQFSNFIDQLFLNPILHCKWLNTLSLMEFVGAQKIMKSVHPLRVDDFLLKHGAEEVRHATFFKRHGVNLGKQWDFFPEYKKEHLLSPLKSLHYIPKLEVFLSRIVKKLSKNDGRDLFKKKVYLLTTYGIEIRAMRIYPLYEERLNAHSFDFSLKGLILEEKSHLNDMENTLGELIHPDVLENILFALKGYEEELFAEWVDSLTIEKK